MVITIATTLLSAQLQGRLSLEERGPHSQRQEWLGSHPLL